LNFFFRFPLGNGRLGPILLTDRIGLGLVIFFNFCQGTANLTDRIGLGFVIFFNYIPGDVGPVGGVIAGRFVGDRPGAVVSLDSVVTPRHGYALDRGTTDRRGGSSPARA